MKVVIEVGANNGRDTKRLLSEYPDCKIISFEPVPALFNHIKETIKDSRVEFINAAVGLTTEKRPFNITVNAGNMPAYGSSSLYNFKSDIQDYWNREDFVIGETIEIDVYSLEDIVDQYGITEIVHLHCDAQGNDLNVLKGLGNHISKVSTGLIEVTDGLNLYDNDDNTESMAREFMQNNNLQITNTKHNDPLKAELNIWFKRV